MRNGAWETAGSQRYLTACPQAVPPPWQSSGQLPCTCWRAEISVCPFSVRNYSLCSESLSPGRGYLSSLLMPELSLGAGTAALSPWCSHHPHRAAWAFSAEQLPHPGAFCSTFPAAQSRAMLLPCLCQPPHSYAASHSRWQTSPLCEHTACRQNCQSKVQLPGAKQGKGIWGIRTWCQRSSCLQRHWCPPQYSAVPRWALLPWLSLLPSLPRHEASPDEQRDRLSKYKVV